MPQAGNRLKYLAPAREDILSIARFHLEQVGPNSARKITEAIEKSVNHLEDFPLLGQTHPDPVLASAGFRRLILPPPYVCVYKVFDNRIFIYRIVNGATDYPSLLV